MAPKRPPEAELGITPEARGAALQRAPREGAPSRVGATARDDLSFMEEVVRELAAQNEQARAEQSHEQSSPERPPVSAERPRTVRVERDSAFRTPEGAPSARAYLPARTLAPGRSEAIETETVKFSDPRKLPTVRVSRPGQRPALTDVPVSRPRIFLSPDDDTLDSASYDDVPLPRESMPGDSAPTLRSAPAAPAKTSSSRSLTPWIAGLLVVAITGVFAVAFASRWWSTRALQGGAAVVSPSAIVQPAPPRKEASKPSSETVPSDAKPASDASSPATALPSSDARRPPPTGPRSGGGSDRWF